MKILKRKKGIGELKNRYGLMFISPWLLGIALFFIIPLVQSVIYSFCRITISSGGIIYKFNGIENYRELLVVNPNYLNWLKEAISTFLYSFPIIMLLSIILALLLNQKFRGRLFFRSLYFLPVIIATSQVVNYVFATTDTNIASAGVSDSYSSGMISIGALADTFGIGYTAKEVITEIISKIFDLIWDCGIQIVLYIAGLQSIPTSLYEASRVEGATKWEEFWFITFPMLSKITLLVSVFTMVEIFTDKNLDLVDQVYKGMTGGVYDDTSAMIWFYFLVIGSLMCIIVFLYQRLLVKHWES